MADAYLTPKELSERWDHKISVKTLANWRSDPSAKGPQFRRFGNKILYPVSAVVSYEQANQYATTRDYRSTARAA